MVAPSTTFLVLLFQSTSHAAHILPFGQNVETSPKEAQKTKPPLELANISPVVFMCHTPDVNSYMDEGIGPKLDKVNFG